MEYLPLELCQALFRAGYPQDACPGRVWILPGSGRAAHVGYLTGRRDAPCPAWPRQGTHTVACDEGLGLYRADDLLACPDILSVLEWLERKYDLLIERVHVISNVEDWPVRWTATAYDSQRLVDGEYPEQQWADNPIDLIRDILAHLQAVQPQSQEAQP